MTPNPQDSAVALEVERAAFEAWMPKFWSRESFKDNEGETIYCDDLVQGAWIGFTAGRASQSDGTTGVPDGWKLVPVEPTPEMCDAGFEGRMHYLRNLKPGFVNEPPDEESAAYRAMLAAAPIQGENHVG